MTVAPDSGLDFFHSAMALEGRLHSTEDILSWVRKRNEEVSVEVTPIAFTQLTNWGIDPATGNIRHTSGRFFSIEGVHVRSEMNGVKSWSQPIINQPEIGYLGFLVKMFNGVLHFLVQAKIEPGNVNKVQLSPTIQATKSNYQRIHQGSEPAYLAYFRERRGRVLLDQLQSEQGARFYKKRNRNIILEIEEDLMPNEDFMWATLGQLKELLMLDNVVNMDTRTVISAISFGSFDPVAMRLMSIFSHDLPRFKRELLVSHLGHSGSVHTNDEIHSWLTELKSTFELQVNLIPLKDVQMWEQDAFSVHHVDRKYFEVIAVDVHISSREVTRWSQPIVRPCQDGVVAFITKKIGDVLHFLVQAKMEVGNLDIIELAPTVQCITGSYSSNSREYVVPYLDEVLNAEHSMVEYSALQSEEGGRFYHNQNRNIILRADDDFPMDEPELYRWMTLNQILYFMRFNNYFNIEARSLLSMLSYR